MGRASVPKGRQMTASPRRHTPEVLLGDGAVPKPVPGSSVLDMGDLGLSQYRHGPQSIPAQASACLSRVSAPFLAGAGGGVGYVVVFE